jgi:putative transposase
VARPLRWLLPEQVYFVTNRTIEERFWLVPTPEVVAIFGFWLAQAVERFNVELFDVLVMSNHFHLLLRAPRGNLPDFMAYVQGNVARDLNRLHGRRGPFWQRRYSTEPVLDHEAELDRTVYTLTNPQKADLVERIEDWPGLSSAGQTLRGEAPQVFARLREGDWRRAGEPEDRSPFVDEATLALRPLPGLEHLGEAERRHAVETLVREKEAELRVERSRQGKRVLGRDAVVRVTPSEQPTAAKRSPRPLCHTSCRERRMEHRTQRRDVVAAYREASARYRKGEVNVEFPKGTFPPSRYPRARYPAQALAA